MSQETFGVCVVTREAYESAKGKRPLSDMMFRGDVVFRYVADLGRRRIEPLQDVPPNLAYPIHKGKESVEYSNYWKEGSEEFGFVDGAEDTCWNGYTFRAADFRISSSDFVTQVLDLPLDDLRMWHEQKETQEERPGYKLGLQNLPNLFHAGILQPTQRPDNDVGLEVYISPMGGPTIFRERFNRVDVLKELAKHVDVFVRKVEYKDGVGRYQPATVEIVADENVNPETKAFVDAVNQSTFNL